MSKTRIYELAKELGVDNKIIISKASELGMRGKVSHSSSLEPDEADQIRRAIIRQAVGPRDSEVVTKRVDKATGATEMIVERRKGNVIRRRRADHAADAVSGEHPQADSEEETAVRAEEATPQPETVEAHAAAVEEEAAVPAELSPEEPAQEEEVVSAEPQAPAEEPVAQDQEQTQGEPEAAIVDAGQAPAAEEEPIVEEPPAEQDVAPAQAEAEPAQPEAAPPEASAQAPARPAVQKKTIGPRVLGKIALPQAKKPAPAAAKKPGPYAPVALAVDETEEEEEARKGKKPVKKKGLKREFSRLDLIDYEGGEARRARTGGKQRRSREEEEERRAAPQEVAKTKASKRVVKITDTITVGELARQMSVKVGEVIAKLMQLGVMATINQALDKDIATIVCEEFDFGIESIGFDESAILQESAADDPALLEPRSPVVTVMGHVDHGKTSLLDSIRKSSVAAKEHGGITQHIGAYQVTTEEGKNITFIDTPGHAAFTAMRARGAKVTDIVVLVVAADDGVMPQTVEAINHAKAAEAPIVVALNKIDKPEANPDRVKKQLAEHGIQPEDWGGDSQFFAVSALKGIGIKELLDGILLLAEVRELKANPNRRAKGAIIETKQERGRGTVATVLVQHGTLRVGDLFVAGSEYGRIRSMDDHSGKPLEQAGPSTPVEITGLSGVPMAGDDFFVVESEANAKQVSAERAQKKLVREQRAAAGPISLEEFARRANNLAAVELNLIIKADVHGSLEAVREAVEKLSTEKVKVRVIHAAVGGLNESDVQLAVASGALIVGFGVRGESRAMADAEAAGVELRFYRVIYELIDDVKAAMAGKLAPVKQEVKLGRVEVRDTFLVPKVGTVAGCYVVDGVVKRGAFVRLLRDSRVVHEGKMASLRRFKDDVREVQNGYECGIGIDGYNDVKAGDVLEVYEVKEVAATID